MKLRIAMLTYSVRARGGVVHALEVAAALARRGHSVELVALARPGERLFRAPAVPTHVLGHEPPEAPFDARIAAMMAAYRDGFAELLAGRSYDIVHSQDCLSANAALELRELGALPHVLRTVHHVDDFTSPSLIACQERSIVGPDAVFCVSEPWVRRLEEEFGVRARLVRNGVDRARYRPPADAAERGRDRAAARLDGRLAVLTVGGIEPRKGSLTLLEGFARLRALVPRADPLLVIAGGTTLFDYRDELERFRRRSAELGVEPHVRLTGPLTPAELERLYRAADVFAFPSRKEGFGLAVLEALAAGLPAVVSDIDVFRSYLRDGRDALLVPLDDAEALARALARLALDRSERSRLLAGARRVVAAHSWDAAADAHERAYLSFLRSPTRVRA